jgi:hypothetical protein
MSQTEEKKIIQEYMQWLMNVSKFIDKRLEAVIRMSHRDNGEVVSSHFNKQFEQLGQLQDTVNKAMLRYVTRQVMEMDVRSETDLLQTAIDSMLSSSSTSSSSSSSSSSSYIGGHVQVPPRHDEVPGFVYLGSSSSLLGTEPRRTSMNNDRELHLPAHSDSSPSSSIVQLDVGSHPGDDQEDDDE